VKSKQLFLVKKNMLCDIYLLQLVFHPLAVVRKLVQNRKETAIYRRRNNTHNNTKKYKNTK